MSLTRERMHKDVADLLGCSPAELSDDTDLTGMGLDSLGLLRLVAKWRHQGFDVSVESLVSDLTVAHWWELAASHFDGISATPLPVGTGGDHDALAEFDVTPMQQAYLIGREDDQPLGGIGCHGYLEFEGIDVEPQRLEAAVFALAERHGMLRARFLPDGRQEILSACPWPGLTVHDLRSASFTTRTRGALDQLRADLSHRRLDAERGGLFDVQLSLLDSGG
jgi:yersiniabactin nonribosomal peptide synthetase